MSLGTTGAAAGGATAGGGLTSIGFGGGGSGLATFSTKVTSTSFSTMMRWVAVPIVSAATASTT